MKNVRMQPPRAVIKLAEEELSIACKILEWEIGDIWGHVGVRLPENKGIAVQLFRRAEESKKDWLVHFDYSLNKLAGVGTIPRESVIYTEIFKARPDVNAAVHCHAAMCVAMSLADKPVSCVHVQSNRFGRGVPIYPRPIYILDESEGADLARTLGGANGMMIKGHGIVTVGKSIDEACINARVHGAHGQDHGHGAAVRLQKRAGRFHRAHCRAAKRSCSPAETDCPTPPSGTTTPT